MAVPRDGTASLEHPGAADEAAEGAAEVAERLPPPLPPPPLLAEGAAVPAVAVRTPGVPAVATSEGEGELSASGAARMAGAKPAAAASAARAGASGRGRRVLAAATALLQERAGWGGASAKQPSAARLRIEYVSNREALALSWVVFVITLLLLAALGALVALKFISDERKVLFQQKTWYVVNVALAAANVAWLLVLALRFGWNLHGTRHYRRSWNHRRLALWRSAAVILFIQILCSIFWLAPFSLTLHYDCIWFDPIIDWLAFFRWTTYNCFFLFCAMTAHSCCRYRGPDPPSDPDEQLVMDITPAQKLRTHAPKMLVFLPFQGLIIVDVYARLTDDRDQQVDEAACRGFSYVCESEPYVQVFNILELVLVAAYTLLYAFYLWRAFQDHVVLPFARYRLSNIYIRLSARHGIAAFLTVIISLVVLASVDYQSCWSYLDSSLGSAPVQLAMSLLVAVNTVAMMPKNVQTNDMLTTWKQRFSWTQEALPAMQAKRDAQLLQRSSQAAAAAGIQRILSGGRRLVAQAAQAATTVAEVPAEIGRNVADIMCVEVASDLLSPLRPEPKPGPPPPPQQQEQHQAQPQPPPEQQQQQEQPQPPPEQQQQQQLAEQSGGAQRSQAEAAGGSQPSSSPQQVRQGEGQLREEGHLRDQGQQRGDQQSGRSLLQRLSSLVPQQQQQQQQQQPRAPMFCFELAVRLFHWSKFAYRHWAGVEGGMSLEPAMRLFGLTDFKAIRDPGSDTRLLLAWKDGTVLVAFRGTASRANAVTDLKFFRTALRPPRFHNGVPAMVHSGFYRAYTQSEQRTSLLQTLGEIVGGFPPGQPLQLYVTGHSLGGALSVLAAYDLQQLYPHASTAVVTFGAPRVGNHAFSCLYRSLVPNTWQVVNDQDPVPRVPATGFRHSGLPVVVNGRGDVIVRPSFFERSVITRTGGVVSHHKMGNYALSLAAVVKAQFSSSKWLPGGPVGATALARALDLSAALAVDHLDLESLLDPMRVPQLNDPGLKHRKKRKAALQQQQQRQRCSGPAAFAACFPRRWGGRAPEEAIAEEAEEAAAMEEGDLPPLEGSQEAADL